METKRPENLQEARRQARHRRLVRRRIALVASAVVLVVLIGIGVLLAVMDVTAIHVEGKTRYSAEEIIEKSGLSVGQNLLSVNKQDAYDRLRDAFPYLETIEVGNTSFSELSITVKEVKLMAAVQVGEEYIIVGENNRALERVAADKVPKDLLVIKGATLQSETVGKSLLDDRSLRICKTMLAAAEKHGLSGMTSVDITKKTMISFMIKDRLEVQLGNESNISNQIALLVKALPTVLSDDDGLVREGRYDMIGYSDNNPDNNHGIFTDKEELERQAAEKKKQEAEKNAQSEDEKKDETGEDDETDTEKPAEE